MAEIIDKTLGHRSMSAKYGDSDIFLSLAAVFLTGGSRIEDANRLSGIFTEISQGCRFCSADTILRMLKAASVENAVYESKSGKRYKFNINTKLNKMLLSGLLKTGQVAKDAGNIFDYDNQFTPAEKCDAEYSYKKAFGRSRLPCSFLPENTAFMILTAFIHNYYRHFLGKLDSLSFRLEKTSRVRRFVFSFVSVPFKWVVRGCRMMQLLYTDNADYMRLQV